MSKTARTVGRFCNENIFKRKDKEIKLKKEAKTFRQINKTSFGFFLKQKKEKTKTKNFDFSLLSNSTTNLLKEMSSQRSIRQNIWDKIFKEYQKKDKINSNDSINKKIIITKSYLGYSINDMFITEINKINNSKTISSFNKINNTMIKPRTNRQIKKPLNIKEIKNEKGNKNPLNNRKSNSFFMNIPYKDSIEIMKYFQHKKMIKLNEDKMINNNYQNINNSCGLNVSKPEKYFNKLIDIKTKNIMVKKDTNYDFMDKLRELRILNYETKINKEKTNKLVEDNKNDIDYYVDLSNHLHNIEYLLNKKFMGKMADYLKFIYSKIKEEREREVELFKQIVALKNQIKKLNLKLKRKNREKSKMLKWIYFLIQVKERRLSIPSYYKDIIENKKDTKIFEVPKKINRISVRVPSRGNKKFNANSLTSRKSFKIKRLLNQPTKNVASYRNEKRNTEKQNIIPYEKIQKVKSYLLNPLFKNVEELKDNLDAFENEILFKNKDYYNIRLQIFNDKNYLQKHLNELIKEKNNFEQKIKTMSEELKEIKKKTNSWNNIKIETKKNQEENEALMNIYNDANEKIKYEKYPLFHKINSLYETCKLFQLNQKQNKILEMKMKDSHPLIAEMIFKLKYITQITDDIFLEFQFYKENDQQKSELIKKIKSEIDKEHKDEKNLEQKLKIKQKSINLFNKVEERNNKIYFLNYRKVDNHDIIPKKNEKKKLKATKSSFFNFDFNF